MPTQIHEENGGKIVRVQVTGKLTGSDYAKLTPEFERLVRQHGKLRLMFDMVDFHGWDAGAAWQDLKLGVTHLSDIERIAMVGETKWQQRMAMFSRPFTRATVRYFDHADIDKAHDWLVEDAALAHAGPSQSIHDSNY
jgi:SpoIIAA-like